MNSVSRHHSVMNNMYVPLCPLVNMITLETTGLTSTEAY